MPLLTREISLLTLLLAVSYSAAASSPENFTFHGFKGANLTLSGLAEITPNGLLRLTNDTRAEVGHAFYAHPLRFSPGASFSCVFVAAIVPEPEHLDRFSHGMTFALAPSPRLPNAKPSEYLGLIDGRSGSTPASSKSNTSSSPRVIAVELDIVKDLDVGDYDNNHIGIDVNSTESVAAAPAAYYDPATASFANFSLVDGDPVWVWVDYDGSLERMNVTVARKRGSRSPIPLLKNVHVDVPGTLAAASFWGFTASTGSSTASHYVLGWSFAIGSSAAPELDPSRLPQVPKIRARRTISPVLVVGISLSVVAVLVAAAAFGWRFCVERRRRYAEELEDWEAEYGPRRFAYKDLYKATSGFRDANVVGSGGFGKVYYGTIPGTGEEVAVKRIAQDSRQGAREFVAEVASMGKLRHRNLIQLLGYCRRSSELLLVYEFMQNGSLDRLLFGDHHTLDWAQRLHIIRGVAAGLLYLHEGWEQVVIHRDIKAANVLLDRDLNGRLGDFGLARLHDRGANPQTTHVVGTLGYLAPEMSHTGKATTATDVYAFGTFLLEVVTGRRPVGSNHSPLKEESEKDHVREPEPGETLVDWVLDCWRKGELLHAVDGRLPGLGGYDTGEAEVVLRLGLLCSHPDPAARLGMKQVVGVLDGETNEPSASPDAIMACSTAMKRNRAFDEFSMSYPLLSTTTANTTPAMTMDSSFGSRSSHH